MTFGKTLKERRSQLDLTQQEVAKKLYISRQTISNWENGKSYPDLDMLIKISDVYHVSIDSLLKGDQELKKSLDTQKVESILLPMEYIPLLLNIATAILTFLVPKNIWVVFVGLELNLIGIALSITNERINSYISGNEKAGKYFVKLLAIMSIIVIVTSVILYFIFGVKTLLKILDITIIIFITTCIFLLIYNSIIDKRSE
ncbi:helix-turn-helix domain-containing protein [Lactobacillus johnsonii]|uniref:helix-turn-helix domain-containing protein n=1 Tax=Lactobacillus johnsonii TaxID=33959 RepID=UPI000F878E2A|nr:helix-turn-helix transcriptional regulator [Lactobacillus johnsonii]MBW8461087.1 helix-turn-helix domain-containing protein [Lactobacillus johnsonii]RST61832.1 XRE family transcriptional regulator [Bifidobacterium animalis subsp. lactis]